MNEAKILSDVELVTGDVRLSFPALFKPKPKAKGNDALTFQVTILLPPATDLKPYTNAMRAAMMAKFGKLIKPSKVTIHKCEEKPEYYPGMDGWHFIAMHSDRPVGVVDRGGIPITDPNVIYPGCWARVYMRAFGWGPNAGGSGVSFGLGAVQFVRDDERLDGRKNADDVFEALELDEPGETTGDEPVDPNDLF